eukprot:m.87921 g.87921  ORF g.87921 m.87921 type:complete len:59 (+) comp12844_c0_seq5:661-837(+)
MPSVKGKPYNALHLLRNMHLSLEARAASFHSHLHVNVSYAMCGGVFCEINYVIVYMLT